MGAGSIGSLFGGFLSKAEHQVTLIARESQVQAIRAHGLCVNSLSGQFKVKPQAVTTPAEIARRHFDIVLLTVKAYDTSEAAISLKDIIHDETIIVSLQNGLGVEEEFLQAFGPREILRILTGCGANLVEPGVVSHNGTAETMIGGYYGFTPAVDVAAECIKSTGLPFRVTNNIQGAVWVKTLVNSAINPLGAILRVTNGELVDDPDVQAMMINIVEEGKQVAEAWDVRLETDPVKAMLTTAEATARNINSMYQDILKNRKTEVDYINGAIVARGKSLNIPTPLNMLLTTIVKALEAKTPKET